jgi:archaellum component FlaC
MMKKLRKFENVKEGNMVSFYTENNQIQQGIVVAVKENIFEVKILECYTRNGIKHFYDTYLHFFKTGTKTHARYTYGNAIEITTNW